MKLGLALSGGGIRGIAHAGVLKALEDNNIKVDVIGGTSSGSMIASLYAVGYSQNRADARLWRGCECGRFGANIQ